MLAIDGYGSRIAEELRALIGDEPVVDIDQVQGIAAQGFDRFLFCAGVLVGKRVQDMTQEEQWSTFSVNYLRVVAQCERILVLNTTARICVVGSESGYTGSFDQAYAGSKVALHRYVENRRLEHPGQQLVCIAPTIISDAGMTLRRTDQEALDARAKAHPKGRWVTAREVARVVYFLLYEDQSYISNTVVRMNGGGHLA